MYSNAFDASAVIDGSCVCVCVWMGVDVRAGDRSGEGEFFRTSAVLLRESLGVVVHALERVEVYGPVRVASALPHGDRHLRRPLVVAHAVRPGAEPRQGLGDHAALDAPLAVVVEREAVARLPEAMLVPLDQVVGVDRIARGGILLGDGEGHHRRRECPRKVGTIDWRHVFQKNGR